MNVAVRLALAPEPCLPLVELVGASLDPQRPWKHVTWRPSQVEAKPIPSSECLTPPSDIKYCWYVDYKQGSQPPPVPCDIVALCNNLIGAVLEYDSYTLQRANYTVQVVALLPDWPEIRRCITGYLVVPPTPRIPFYFLDGLRSAKPSFKMNTMYFVGGGRDPDKNPDPLGENIMNLDLSLECSTDDLNAKTWCDGDMSNVDDNILIVMSVNDGTIITPSNEIFAFASINAKQIRPGFMYNITAKAKETEWPYRAAEATLERQLVNTGPSPLMIIKCARACNLQRLLATEQLELVAICSNGCLNTVAIMYHWMVDQEGIGPVDLTIHSVQGKAKDVGLKNMTILPGVFTPGAKVSVRLLANYYPTTPEEISEYQDLYDQYKEYQQNKP